MALSLLKVKEEMKQQGEETALRMFTDEMEGKKSVQQQQETETLLKELESDGRYLMIDIGSNLTNKKFQRDLDGVVKRAKDAGIMKIVVTGTSIHSSKEALRLTRLYPGSLYCTAGVHPHDAKSWSTETYDTLREIASNPECVAIGECGLDFKRNYSEPDIQIQVFKQQVELACELKKPLFIHERDAHTSLIDILEQFLDQLPFTVIHCFTGSRQELQKYISMGFYIGLTGYLWKDKSEDGIRKSLEDGLIPLDRLLLESDSPFMYPNTRASKLPSYVKSALTERSVSFLHRYCTFQRNEPCSLLVTVEMIAAYLKIKPADVALKTTYSALKVFGLS